MGLIAKVLSFVRGDRNGAQTSFVKHDPGGSPTRRAEHFSAPGDDSFPLTTDYVFAADVRQTGKLAAVGYVDPLNTPVAAEGEKRIYGRAALTGSPVNEVHLKNTGEIDTFNDSCNATLNADGSIVLSNDNGSVTLGSDGSVTCTNSSGSITLAANGATTISNTAGGSIELQAGGKIDLNGVEITTTGNVTVPTSLVLAGKEIAGHVHLAGTPPGDTGPNK